MQNTGAVLLNIAQQCLAKPYPPTGGRQRLPFIPRLFKPASVNHLLLHSTAAKVLYRFWFAQTEIRAVQIAKAAESP